MADVIGSGRARTLVDADGDAVTVTSSRLDVNAYLSATPTIDIGDVSLLLGGTAASTNSGTNTDQTLRVTLAVDDTLTQTMLGLSRQEDAAHSSADKGIMALGVRNDDLSTTFSGTNGDYTPIAVNSAGAVNVIDPYTQLFTKQTGTVASTSAHYGIGALAVRNDDVGSYVGIADGDYTFLQVSANGALYVTGESKQQTAVTDYGFSIMGEAKTIDGSTLPNTVSEGNAARLSMSRAGIAYTCLTDTLGASDLGATITTHLSEIEGAVETIEGAIGGSEMQVDIVSAPTLTVSGTVTANAGTNLNTSALATHAKQDTIITHLSEIEGAVETIEAAVDTQMQVDIVASLPAGTNAIGKLSANSGVDIGDVTVDNLGNWVSSDGGAVNSPVHAGTESYNATDSGFTAMAVLKDVLTAGGSITDGEYTPLATDTQGALYTTHGITGMQSDNNEGVDSSTAEVLKSSTACKRVDMQADPANTGYIYVGGSDVSATKGIRLAPGDFYSIDVNNTADIYVLASVDEEDIHFTYYT